MLARFKEAYTEAQYQSNSKADRQKRNYDRATSTVQLMPGDTVLKKADMFQGKRKVKDRWSEVEYEVIPQVANGMPSYEIKDPSSNFQVAHRNRLFLLAIPCGKVMPLNKSENADINVSTRSTLVELTSLEVENDSPKEQLGRCLTQHLASRVPLAWVDGILQPLPMVVHRTAQYEPGSRMKDMSGDDEEVH